MAPMRFAAFFTVAMVLSQGLAAQTPSVAPELLNRTLPRTDSEIRFCIGETAYQRPLEEDLAQAIAGTLLLGADIHYYPPLNSPSPYDYVIGPTLDEMFVLLTNECDAFMGMNLVGDLADWLIFSRPLYTTHFSLVAPASSPLEALADMDADKAIGTRVSSVGDLRLGTYLRHQPTGSKPRRFPYNDNETLFTHLGDGEIDAALIWAPALIGLSQDRPEAASLHALDTGAFDPPEITFGIVYRSESVYLRAMIDEAIAQLQEDGTIQSILDAHYPGATAS